MMDAVFENMGALFPAATLEKLRDMLRYAGMPYYGKAKVWLGSVIAYALLFAVIVAAAVFMVRFRPFGIATLASTAIFFLISLFLGLFIPYLSLHYKVDNRREAVERILPDLLYLLASNIRAGMTPMMALRTSARKEFEPLSGEIIYVTNKSLGIGSFTESLLELSESIRSELLERTMMLFATSLISGGNVPAILENAATDMRETQRLKQRLVGGVNVYILFILFTLIVGMPLLFGVSIRFVEVLDALSTAQGGGALSGPAPSVGPVFITQISVLTLLVTSILASALIGVVRDGDEMNGLRYAVPVALASLVAFFVFKYYVLNFLIPVM